MPDSNGKANINDLNIKLRRYLNDTPELNRLDQVAECTDDDLNDYIKDTMDELNLQFPPITTFKISDVTLEPGDGATIPWSLVKLGATLQFLTSKGILSARNMLTYSDTGGVQVSDYDRYGRYINFFNVLIQKYVQAATQFKIAYNASQCFGGVYSPLDAGGTWY
jgi:hypothetical protein